MRYSELLLLACICTIMSCGPSAKESLQRDQPPLHQPQGGNDSIPPSAAQIPLPVETTKSWTPKFIPTGDAAGIMVEFTGLKKTAQLNARYAFIELRRLPAEIAPAPKTASPVGYLENRPPVEAPRAADAEPMLFRTTINDLRQAFFNVPPGKYFFRQTKDWADRSVIRNLEVREGHYSVIRIDVFNAWSAKMKQLSESYEEK